jgi:RsiW-degrading membrane proteinase PrsW (M82 family)
MSTGILRAITAVPGHFLFAVIMGYYFSLAKFKPDHKTSYLFKSLFCAILAHGLYDGILMSIDALKVENEFILLVICIAFIALIIKLWKIGLKHIRELSGSEDPHPALKDNK